MQPKATYVLLTNGQGSIEPNASQVERIDELVNRIAAREFHTHVSGSIVNVCIDGRGGGKIGPNSAGATMSLVVAEDLTTARYGGKDDSLKNGFKEIGVILKRHGESAAVHGDEKNITDNEIKHNENCGCGAIDKLNSAYELIVSKADVLFDLAAAYGYPATPEQREKILQRARARTQFTNGHDIAVLSIEENGKDSVSVLSGVHKEVVAILNTKPHTSLDRKLIEQQFGDNYQAFNIDPWAFKSSAELISENDEEVKIKSIAMAIYNLAVAHVLCGPSMRVLAI